VTIRTPSLAALYDIHGNLPALNAVLAEVRSLGVETVVVGGDIVAGPMPVETLEVLRDRRGVMAIRGNADRELLDGSPAPRDERAERAWAWTAERLSSRHRAWLAGLPASLTIETGRLGPVLFCHGSPRSDEEIITRISPDDRVSAMLSEVAEAVVVCGHTHVQFDRTIDGRRVINAGSVGLPYQDRPGAYWALLSDDVELRRTLYDLDGAAELIGATGFPGAAQVAETLRNPPTSEEASVHFETAAGRSGENG